MNVLIEGDDSDYIAREVANMFGYTVMSYDSTGTKYYMPESHWILSQGPSTSREYRNLCLSGLNPDIVFVISRSSVPQDKIDTLRRFYDAVTVHIDARVNNLIANVIASINGELSSR